MRSFLLLAVVGLWPWWVFILIVAIWISALVFYIRVNSQEKEKPVVDERQPT
jgi:hypothetical protein